MVKLTTKEQWLDWLEKMHIAQGQCQEEGNQPDRYETAAAILGIVTYDSEMSEALVRIMMPTLLAIGTKTTYTLIADKQRHLQFCMTVNMPILQGRLDWGTSIRGAWYRFNVPFDPHHGVIGHGSRGFDIVDAAPIGKGEEASFTNLIMAMHHFLEQEDQVATPQ